MKYFLVDTENVARQWAQFSDAANAGDIFLLFYSKNVGPVNMSLFGPACLRGVQFSFIECYIGHSAMDFQIATELGRLIALHPDAEYSIISKDRGFDPVIRYWQDRGIQISREEPTINPTSNPKRDVTREYQTRLEALGITDPDLRVATDILVAAMSLPEKKRRAAAYRRFLECYGRLDGLSRYRTVKSLVAEIAAHGPFPPAASDPADASKTKQPSTPAQTDGPDKSKTVRRPGTLDEAISAMDIELSGKQRKKLSNMFLHACKMKSNKNVYREQLNESFGSSDGTRIFMATEFLL